MHAILHTQHQQRAAGSPQRARPSCAAQNEELVGTSSNALLTQAQRLFDMAQNTGTQLV